MLNETAAPRRMSWVAVAPRQNLVVGMGDVLAKPTSAFSIGNLAEQLVIRIRAAAVARSRRSQSTAASSIPRPSLQATHFHPRQLILLGSSTGGTEALKEILSHLPSGLPPIVIAQHIPAHFSRAFADRMNEICAIEVREAEEGDLLEPGLALVAPGDFHLGIQWHDQGFQVRLNQRTPVHHCRPAVDVLFRSAAQCPGARITAGILTGMGSDGAVGMQTLKAAGAQTFVQDESSCVVYGIPRAAVERGVVDRILPLEQIPSFIVETASRMSGSREPLVSSGRAHSFPPVT